MPDQFCANLNQFVQYFNSDDFRREIVYLVLYVGIEIKGDNPQAKYPSSWGWRWEKTADGYKRIS